MNIAIIGASGHFHYVLESLPLLPEARVTCIAPTRAEEDISELAQKCAAQGQDPRRYDTWEALLNQEKLDMVAVNGWFCDSAKIAMQCLKKGIHVFSEKPLATNTKELDELEAVYNGASACLAGMLDGPYQGWYQAIEKAVRDGEIGIVRTMHAQKSYRMGNRGPVYKKLSTYGGMLPWIAIHGVNWIYHLLQKPVVSVQAQTDDAYNRGNGEMQTTGAMLLKFKDGEIATVTADFLRPTASARHDDDRLRVTGTKGMLEAIDGRVYLENDQPRRELPTPEYISPFYGFVKAIENGTADALAREALYISRICVEAAKQ